MPYINHPKVSELVDRLKPDIIAVFGTSLIRGPLLAGARLGIINLHVQCAQPVPRGRPVDHS